MKDWVQWHSPYADPSSDLSRRRRSVQAQIRVWLAARPAGPLTVVSACAGEGADILGVLAEHATGDRVRAVLLETDDRLADAAESFARENGLGNVEVRRADAGITDSYVDAVPADLVLLCGVFGNITDDDIRATITLLPQLCAPDAAVVWTRGRFATGDLTPTIRQWFVDAGCQELTFDAPDDTRYRVGVNRFTGQPRPLEPGLTFFTFLG